MTTIVGTPPGVTASGYRVTPPPIPVTGLAGWYDATKTASFTFFTGAAISQWNDLSGNGRHVTPANSSWASTRVAAGINGLPAVDAHPGALSTSSLDLNPPPFTLIAAIKAGSNTGTPALIGAAYTQPTTGSVQWDVASGIVRLTSQATTIIGSATSALTASTPAVLVATYGSNVWAHYRNGAAVGTGTQAATFSHGKIALGAVAAHNNALYDGLLGEIIIYSRVLTTPERQQVETYLQTKWGIV